MSGTDSSHDPQAAMATPREPIESLDYHDIPSNDNDNNLVSSPFTLNATINCDKELPPMPQPSLVEEEEPEDTVYGDSGREDDFLRERTTSWMDMDSGSESDDTGEHYSLHAE